MKRHLEDLEDYDQDLLIKKKRELLSDEEDIEQSINQRYQRQQHIYKKLNQKYDLTDSENEEDETKKSKIKRIQHQEQKTHTYIPNQDQVYDYNPDIIYNQVQLEQEKYQQQLQQQQEIEKQKQLILAQQQQQQFQQKLLQEQKEKQNLLTQSQKNEQIIQQQVQQIYQLENQAKLTKTMSIENQTSLINKPSTVPQQQQQKIIPDPIKEEKKEDSGGMDTEIDKPKPTQIITHNPNPLQNPVQITEKNDERLSKYGIDGEKLKKLKLDRINKQNMFEPQIQLYKKVAEKYQGQDPASIITNTNTWGSGFDKRVQENMEKPGYSLDTLRQYLVSGKTNKYYHIVYSDLQCMIFKKLKLKVQAIEKVNQTFCKPLPFTYKNQEDQEPKTINSDWACSGDIIEVISNALYMTLLDMNGHSLLKDLSLGQLMEKFTKVLTGTFDQNNIIQEGLELFHKSEKTDQFKLWAKDFELRNIFLMSLITVDFRDIIDQVHQRLVRKSGEQNRNFEADFNDFKQRYSADEDPNDIKGTLQRGQKCQECYTNNPKSNADFFCYDCLIRLKDFYMFWNLERIVQKYKHSNDNLIGFLKLLVNSKKSIFNTIIVVYLIPFCERFFRQQASDQDPDEQQINQKIRQLLIKIIKSDIMDTEIQPWYGKLVGNEKKYYNLTKNLFMKNYFEPILEFRKNVDNLESYFQDTNQQNRIFLNLISEEFMKPNEKN